jgi:tetraacyldisaccharide 4'-kinase
MVRNWVLKILLLPIALIYGFFAGLYSKLYDLKFLIPIKFTLPVISIGNLSVGGTGKTPHTEYLINLLKPYIRISVLSRGYKRTSKGFQEVLPNSDVKNAGDEPLLFRKKYPDMKVFVAESRVEGISQMLMKSPDIQTVLLDDAFQHREIDPGLNILLTEFDFPFFDDFFLPFGRLREWRSAYKRADTIIVTKCPLELNEEKKNEFLHRLSPLKSQKVFFSFYKYFQPYFMYDTNKRTEIKKDQPILLISALASTSYLISYLQTTGCDFHSMEFNDHHEFTFDEIENMKSVFSELKGENKIILTTEKDAMRLNEYRNFILTNDLPVFVLPVSVNFLFDQKREFDNYIKDFLLQFKS